MIDSIFLRYCVIKLLDITPKIENTKTSFRFNGTSDWHILRMPVTITRSD